MNFISLWIGMNDMNDSVSDSELNNLMEILGLWDYSENE